MKKRFVIKLGVIMLFSLFLCSCNSNSVDYSKESIMRLSKKNNFGYGKLDYSLVALCYVYTNADFSSVYGEDFEASFSGGSANLKDEFSYVFTKGKARAHIEINKDIWCINLIKPFLGKWTVEDCYLCGNDNDEYGNIFTKYDSIEEFEKAIISGEKKQDINKLTVYCCPKSIPEDLTLKEVEVWDDFVAYKYYHDSSLYLTFEWYKDKEFDNIIGLYSNGNRFEKDGFVIISAPEDEYKDVLWTQYGYQFHAVLLASSSQEIIDLLCDAESIVVK